MVMIMIHKSEQKNLKQYYKINYYINYLLLLKIIIIRKWEFIPISIIWLYSDIIHMTDLLLKYNFTTGGGGMVVESEMDALHPTETTGLQGNPETNRGIRHPAKSPVWSSNIKPFEGFEFKVVRTNMGASWYVPTMSSGVTWMSRAWRIRRF